MKKKYLLMFAIQILLINAVLLAQKPVFDSCVDTRDNKIYKAIKIAEQTWMAENLAYSCEGSFAYEDLEKNVKKFGRLYTYDASFNACPSGWRLPSKADWEQLDKILDPKEEGIIGDKLAKKTNPGFASLMAGYKTHKNKYVDKDAVTCYWGSDNAVNLSKDASGVAFTLYNKLDEKDKLCCFSIRCIKD